MEFPNFFYKAISFIESVNEDHTEFIKRDKKGNINEDLIALYPQEIGRLRLIKEVVDIPVLGKENQVIFVLSDEDGQSLDIPILKKYFSNKNLKRFDLRGKYAPGRAVVGGDAAFYLTPQTLGRIPNQEILNIYKSHSNNAIVLTARVDMDGMKEGIEERLAGEGVPSPLAVFTKPPELSSGKYKAHVIGQIAQQEAVSRVEFYDDNLKYITDVKNILENIYGSEIYSKVNIHKVSTQNKPEEANHMRLAQEKDMETLIKLTNVANKLDEKGLIKEADRLDAIISEVASNIKYAAKKKKALYTAAFLTPEGRAELERWWLTNVKGADGQLSGILENTFMCHMTIKWKPSFEEVEALPIDKIVALKVVGYADDSRGQAILVAGVESDNPHPHITIATVTDAETGKKVSPAYSNELLGMKEHVTLVDKGPELEARIGFHNGKEPRYDFEGSIYEVSLEQEIP